MDAKDTVFYSKKTLKLNGKILDLSTPLVMGILNVTPDSFYDGGKYQETKAIVDRAGQLLQNGATIIDIGGYSSRPGAGDISESEEMDRVIPCTEAIIKAYPGILLSIDTFRATVAKAAIEAGACMVNDISGGSLDKAMFETVAQLRVPYVLMHMRGTPQNMVSQNNYDNLLWDILQYLEKKVFQLRKMGLTDIIVDVGFGFAKSIRQNYELLKNLDYFEVLNLPLLVGISRKSMIYKRLGVSVEEALNGTTVLNTIALTKGASILRVHDVKEAAEAVKLFKLCNE